MKAHACRLRVIGGSQARSRVRPNFSDKQTFAHPCGASEMCHSRHSLQRRKAVGYFTIAYAPPDGTHVPAGAVDSINRDQRTRVADLPTTPSRVRLLFKN